jgi:hypothetical protein
MNLMIKDFDDELHQQLRVFAVKNKITLQVLVPQIIKEYLSQAHSPARGNQLGDSQND